MENINRREFCKGAAGLAGIIAAGYGPSLYAAGANDKVRVACVGYSDRFRHTLLPCFLHHNKELNFDMVAVADLWKKRLYEHAKPEIEKAVGHDVEAFASDVALYEAKERLGLDAVIISTADFQHAQHAVHAVEAGCDAYCEKPIAEDMYSANMLLDAVNAKRALGAMKPGSVLQIGSQRRSGKKYMAAKEFINSGKFGDISYVHLTWNVNQPRRWRRDEKLIASLKSSSTAIRRRIRSIRASTSSSASSGRSRPASPDSGCATRSTLSRGSSGSPIRRPRSRRADSTSGPTDARATTRSRRSSSTASRA